MIFMIITRGWAMIRNIVDFTVKHNHLLLGIGLVVFLLEIWMIIEGVVTIVNNIKATNELPQH